MGGILIHKQQISLTQTDGGSVDNVDALTGAHVHRLHVVVSVLREVDKPGMWPERNQLSGGQELPGVDGIVPTFHVQCSVNCATTTENGLLLCRDPAEPLKYICIQFPTSQQNFFCKYDSVIKLS